MSELEDVKARIEDIRNGPERDMSWDADTSVRLGEALELLDYCVISLEYKTARITQLNELLNATGFN